MKINLTTDSVVDVDTIATEVIRGCGGDPRRVERRYTGGRGGWPGDVPQVRLSPRRLAARGWRARLTARQAVARAAREIAAETPA